jgi:hypothetical protein
MPSVCLESMGFIRRKMRDTEVNAKCRHLKIDLQRDSQRSAKERHILYISTVPDGWFFVDIKTVQPYVMV